MASREADFRGRFTAAIQAAAGDSEPCRLHLALKYGTDLVDHVIAGGLPPSVDALRSAIARHVPATDYQDMPLSADTQSDLVSIIRAGLDRMMPPPSPIFK